MFDFSNLNSNLEGYTITNLIIIVLVSFALSSLIAITYQSTSREVKRPKYFIQSLILISIPVAMVMLAIGDSLARGLGMLGALAIIRFRTTLRNPRNMVFMFLSIAVGIATGVYGILIASVGTVSFCFIVFLIHLSPISKSNFIVGNLQIEFPDGKSNASGIRQNIEAILQLHCAHYSLEKYHVNGRDEKNTGIKTVVLAFEVKVSDQDKAREVVNKLSELNGISNVRINFKDDFEKI